MQATAAASSRQQQQQQQAVVLFRALGTKIAVEKKNT